MLASHRADLLPLSVQLRLLIGLFEAAGLPALRHLDAILEGGPAGTNFSVSTKGTQSSPDSQSQGNVSVRTLAAPPCCSCSRNIPPECRSPSGPAAPSCYPETHASHVTSHDPRLPVSITDITSSVLVDTSTLSTQMFTNLRKIVYLFNHRFLSADATHHY